MEPKTAPRRWKSMLLTIAGLYPIVLCFNALIAPHLAALPVALRSVPITIAAPPLLAYVVLPPLHRLARNWLSR